MIGLVFLGTIYYLESGWREYDLFRDQMETMTIRGAQLIIAYFSTVLVLSLLQEPFVSRGVSHLAFVVLVIGVILVTRFTNEALRSFENASPTGWNSLLFKSSRVLNWVAFAVVFLLPPLVFRDTGTAGSVLRHLTLSDIGVAWIVLLALLFGYWNLVQFLLLPYDVREMERGGEQ